jgi:hypothetical protein
MLGNLTLQQCIFEKLKSHASMTVKTFRINIWSLLSPTSLSSTWPSIWSWTHSRWHIYGHGHIHADTFLLTYMWPRTHSCWHTCGHGHIHADIHMVVDTFTLTYIWLWTHSWWHMVMDTFTLTYIWPWTHSCWHTYGHGIIHADIHMIMDTFMLTYI